MQCTSGGCGDCNVSVNTVPRVLLGLATGTDEEILALIVENADVVVNVSRSAIQVAGCTGDDVVASVPVPMSRLTALRDRLVAAGILNEAGHDVRDQRRLAVRRASDTASLALALRF